MSEYNRSELLELIPIYALGALSDSERELVEALLAVDAEAQNLLQQYEQVTPTLSLSATERPAPPELKSKLLQTIRTENITSAEPSPPPTNISVLRQRLVALAAVFALLVGAIGYILLQDNPTPEGLYQQIVAVDTSQRLPIVSTFSDAIMGDLVISNDGSQAVIRVEDLPALQADQSFQLWLIDDAGAVSGGVYQFESVDTQYIELPLERSAFSYNAFGVSLEPAEGSPFDDAPSGPQVFAILVQ